MLSACYFLDEVGSKAICRERGLGQDLDESDAGLQQPLQGVGEVVDGRQLNGLLGRAESLAEDIMMLEEP